MTKLRDFLNSGEFEESLVKARVSSLPRWRYARELPTDPSKKRTDPDYDGYSSGSDDEFVFVSVCAMRQCFLLTHTYDVPLKMKGVARAQRSFIDETRKIARARDPLVELIVNRSDSPETMRLLAWRSLAATA